MATRLVLYKTDFRDSYFCSKEGGFINQSAALKVKRKVREMESPTINGFPDKYLLLKEVEKKSEIDFKNW
jgi:hypothetical protein